MPGPVGTFPGHPASLVRQVADLVPRLIFLRQTCPRRKLWTTGEIGKCTRYWLILKDRCFVKYGNSILALWGNALILKRCALEKKEPACGKYIHGCPPGLTGFCLPDGTSVIAVQTPASDRPPQGGAGVPRPGQAAPLPTAWASPHERQAPWQAWAEPGGFTPTSAAPQSLALHSQVRQFWSMGSSLGAAGQQDLV